MPVKQQKTDKKDLWDKLSSAGPLLIALAVSAIGGWFNFQQASLENANHRQELFTSLLAQRERADSDLRASMFNTLFEAYFGGKLSNQQAETAAKPKGQFDPEVIRSQIMFLNLLARNFETIDIKPLFEELDRQLTTLVNDERAGNSSKAAFVLRQKLRKVGKLLAFNQVKNLASLRDTHTERVFVKKCGPKPAELHTIGNTEVQGKIIDVTNIANGKVRVVLDAPDTASDNGAPLRFSISFYDMPYIDNTHLSSNVRLAIVLEQYISPRHFWPFLDQIVDRGIADEVRRSHNKAQSSDCDQAVIRLIQFPAGYMGLRDRPYLEDVYRRIRIPD